MVQDTYNIRPLVSSIIERRHFQQPWTIPTPDFKVMKSFNETVIANTNTSK